MIFHFQDRKIRGHKNKFILNGYIVNLDGTHQDVTLTFSPDSIKMATNNIIEIVAVSAISKIYIHSINNNSAMVNILGYRVVINYNDMVKLVDLIG